MPDHGSAAEKTGQVWVRTPGTVLDHAVGSLRAQFDRHETLARKEFRLQAERYHSAARGSIRRGHVRRSGL
jgi:hypothetical protein